MPPKPILIVEDYEPDAKLIGLTLKRAGVANPLIFLTDGDEALAYLKGDGLYGDRKANPLPGAVLLDIKLPRNSGYEVLEWCRAQSQFKDLLIVVLSGQGGVHDINRAYHRGANTFLSKPATDVEVLEMIQHFTGPWVIFPRPGNPHERRGF